MLWYVLLFVTTFMVKLAIYWPLLIFFNAFLTPLCSRSVIINRFLLQKWIGMREVATYSTEGQWWVSSAEGVGRQADPVSLVLLRSWKDAQLASVLIDANSVFLSNCLSMSLPHDGRSRISDCGTSHYQTRTSRELTSLWFNEDPRLSWTEKQQQQWSSS